MSLRKRPSASWQTIEERVAALEAQIEELPPRPEEVCQSLDSTRLGQILRRDMPEEEVAELCRQTRQPFEALYGPAFERLLILAKDENPEAFKQVSELLRALWWSQYDGAYTVEKARATLQKVDTLLAPPVGGPTETAPAENGHGAVGEQPAPSAQAHPKGKRLIKRRSGGADDAGEAGRISDD